MKLNQMLGRKVITYSLLVLAAGAGAGCEAMGEKKANAATAQWRAARSSVMMKLAREQFENGNFDGARKSCGEALTLMPESVDLHVFCSRIAIEQGNLELAESELNQASALDPKAGAPDYYRGVLMQRWQRMPRALELYTAAAEKSPKELAYLLAQAETLVAMDREADALALVQKAQGNFENSAELRAMQGQILLRQRRFADAVDQLREATLLAPEDTSIREQLARALFSAGKKPEALAALERLFADEKFAKRADLQTQYGECLLAADRPADAKAAFETASNLQPGNLSYTLNLAKAALEVGDIRRADLTLRRAVALSPGDAQANLLMGFVRMEQNKPDEAVIAFRRAAAADPKDSTAPCMVGVALEKLGQRPEALQQYAKALTISPDDVLAKRRLASLEASASISPD